MTKTCKEFGWAVKGKSLGEKDEVFALDGWSGALSIFETRAEARNANTNLDGTKVGKVVKVEIREVK